MGRLGFNSAAKAPTAQQQQDAENAAGVDGKNEDVKAAEIYFNEGTNSKIKAMRLLVLALLVTCVFMSGFIALPQLTRLCKIDSNSSDVNYKVFENITRLMEINQEYSDKINSLLLQLQAVNDRKEKLESILGSSGLLIDSLDSYNPIFNSESGNNFMPIIDSTVEDENPFRIPSPEDVESAIDTIY